MLNIYLPFSKKKEVYTKHQKFSESSKILAAPGPSKQEHVTP